MAGRPKYDSYGALKGHRKLLDWRRAPCTYDEELLKELGAPAGYKAVAPLIFGYPKSRMQMPEKIEPDIKWLR